jgi:hypothetical protein
MEYLEGVENDLRVSKLKILRVKTNLSSMKSGFVENRRIKEYTISYVYVYFLLFLYCNLARSHHGLLLSFVFPTYGPTASLVECT